MDPQCVFVPMEVDVYLNYASPNPIEYQPPRPHPVYLAPIPQPNYAALRLESQFIQHDIFDHVRTPPVFATADPYRLTDHRSGIYLHWSLPPTYRVGLAAAGDSQTLQAQKQKGGYPDVPGEDGSTVFRQVPNRWIIRRTVSHIPQSGNLINLRIRHTTSTGSDQEQLPVRPMSVTNDEQSNLGHQKTVFVVESDQVRMIEKEPATEDFEVTSSPYVDLDLPVWQQGRTVLGKSYRLSQWKGGAKSGKYAPSLTTVRTANPYFADFQPHNSSVFSFFDDLSVTYDGSLHDDPSVKYTSGWQLAHAYISYSIVGYHVDSSKDPLAIPLFRSPNSQEPNQTPKDRLAACQLRIKDPSFLQQATLDKLGQNSTQMRTICHGSFTDIHWNIVLKEKDIGNSILPLTASVRYPGDSVQALFDTSHPVALGTNALDALFGWLDVQDPQLISNDVQAQLLRLQTFVLDINDNLDAQLQAEDLLATNNFVPAASGTRYSFKNPEVDGQNFLQNLIDRNDQQTRYDGFVRQYDYFKQQLFSLWWTFICDFAKSSSETTQTPGILKRAVQSLQTKMSSSMNQRYIVGAQPKQFQDSIRKTADDPFYMQQDPTLLIAGLQSSWPKDPSDNVNVRLKEQLEPVQDLTKTTQIPNENGYILSLLANKVPKEVYDSVAACWYECDRLTGADGWSYASKRYNVNSKVNPDYFDRDLWNSNNDNGWFPLFIEWTVEYYDIPWQYWEFAPYGPEGRIGYRIKAGVDLQALGLADGCVVISGRSPALPQASATLETALKQVFSKVNPEILATVETLDQNALFEAVRNLDFLSTTLSGLTDQLTTRMSGTHANPVHNNGGKPYVPAQILTSASQSLGMTESDFLNMDSGSAKTPFASIVPVTADTSRYSPFKPVTHGQFRFTKLNIIDKFGQMVQGIKLANGKMAGMPFANGDPSDVTHTPLFPCLSETYSLEGCTWDPKLKGFANAVLRRADGFCSFVQLPPSINQPARLNADFVTQANQQGGLWRRLEDHENPCRGYLVINYANASFQVFTTAGQFVREYSVRNGQIATMPFPANTSLGAVLDPLLQKLLDNFKSTDYLVRLFENICTTIQAVQANPSHVAEKMLSILGRPLALVTFGISLELEGPPLTNQSTVPITKPPVRTDSVIGYDFKVKIGDRDNVFDGLYGLFGTGLKPNDFDFSTFYSYHDSDLSRQPRNVSLNPFYPDPMDNNYTNIRKQQYKVYAALVDPFTPTHCYTAILPIKQLQIPPWALQQGIDRIAAFFKMGPILSPTDVPAFDPSKAVKEDYRLDDPNRPSDTGVLPVPAVSVADWSWLQPYWQKQADGTGKTQYNLLGIQNVDMQPRYEQPPYVVTEGYLQMKTSFVKSDTNT